MTPNASPALQPALAELQNTDLSGDLAQPVSLEDRLMSAYAHAADASSQQHAALMRAAADPAVTSDPEQLYQLQTSLSEYVIKMNLTSTLARKSVGCVETLIKAQ